MITAATVKRPLPVRPVDGLASGIPAFSVTPGARGIKHPLPVVPRTAQAPDLGDALRTAAHLRLMATTSVKHPLPVQPI